MQGACSVTRLMRFGLLLNGESVGYPILNDILVAHANPAAVSKYDIHLEEGAETQKSSGIWIATPAGSTAAIRSAGGYVLPLESQTIQYLIREPCPPPARSYRHLKGIRSIRAPFSIHSRMDEGQLYLDGPHLALPFQTGDRLEINPEVPPLSILGMKEKNRA